MRCKLLGEREPREMARSECSGSCKVSSLKKNAERSKRLLGLRRIQSSHVIGEGVETASDGKKRSLALRKIGTVEIPTSQI